MNLQYSSMIIAKYFIERGVPLMILNKLMFSLILVLISTFLVSCHTNEKKLTIGMIPLREEAEMVNEYELIRSYLEQQLGVPVEFVVTDSYASLIEEMENETIDIGFYGAFSFVVAESKLDLTPLVTQQRKGIGTYYQSLIIAKKGSNLHSIEDLEGKSFAFAEEGSTSGFVLPYALFKSRNIEYEHYFKEHIFSGTHEKVALDIISGKVDAGAISSGQFDYLEREGKISKDDFNILWKSEDIPASLFVARSELSDETKEKFVSVMLKIHEENPEALDSLNEKVEKYVIANDDHYNSIRNISTILGNNYMQDHFLNAGN